jgi:hypothetical protein
MLMGYSNSLICKRKWKNLIIEKSDLEKQNKLAIEGSIKENKI